MCGTAGVPGDVCEGCGGLAKGRLHAEEVRVYLASAASPWMARHQALLAAMWHNGPDLLAPGFFKSLHATPTYETSKPTLCVF